MHRSKLFSWVGARPVALVLTVGVLFVGLTACGSSSSTKSKRSSSSVVKKEAALAKEVHLTVINNASEPVNDAFCRDQVFYSVLNPPSICNLNGLYPDPPDNKDASTGNPVYGDIQWAQSGSGRVYFEAHNPAIGEPSITLISASPPNDPIEKFTLGVGDTKEKAVGSHVYSMHRGDDTDYKMMSITLIR